MFVFVRAAQSHCHSGYAALKDFFPSYTLRPNPACTDPLCLKAQEEYSLSCRQQIHLMSTQEDPDRHRRITAPAQVQATTKGKQARAEAGAGQACRSRARREQVGHHRRTELRGRARAAGPAYGARIRVLGPGQPGPARRGGREASAGRGARRPCQSAQAPLLRKVKIKKNMCVIGKISGGMHADNHTDSCRTKIAVALGSRSVSDACGGSSADYDMLLYLLRKLTESNLTRRERGKTC